VNSNTRSIAPTVSAHWRTTARVKSPVRVADPTDDRAFGHAHAFEMNVGESSGDVEALERLDPQTRRRARHQHLREAVR
jgi:hypothetical protein